MICNSFETRNRHKNDEYKIPSDMPQCPIFKDNRCCGGCELIKTCEHCVDCGCFGFIKSSMGGTDESYYMRKASETGENGRLTDKGEFDWTYYKLQKNLMKITPNKYIFYHGRSYKIISQADSNGFFKALSIKSKKMRKINAHDVKNLCDSSGYMHVYNSL